MVSVLRFERQILRNRSSNVKILPRIVVEGYVEGSNFYNFEFSRAKVDGLRRNYPLIQAILNVSVK